MIADMRINSSGVNITCNHGQRHHHVRKPESEESEAFVRFIFFKKPQTKQKEFQKIKRNWEMNQNRVKIKFDGGFSFHREIPNQKKGTGIV